jgi:hypothetical protein
MFYLVHISFCFPHSLRFWLGWLERPFSFWHVYAANEKDARSFLSTSEGWPCGHWELVSGAAGLDEKSPLMLSHGHSLNDTLLTRVHAPALSLTGCDDKDDDMQPVYSIATIENF